MKKKLTPKNIRYLSVRIDPNVLESFRKKCIDNGMTKQRAIEYLIGKFCKNLIR